MFRCMLGSSNTFTIAWRNVVVTHGHLAESRRMEVPQVMEKPTRNNQKNYSSVESAREEKTCSDGVGFSESGVGP